MVQCRREELPVSGYIMEFELIIAATGLFAGWAAKRSPRWLLGFGLEQNGNPFQYSCLENSMDRGARSAIIHGVTRVGHDLETKPPPPPTL